MPAILVLVGRILLSVLFILAGGSKLADIAGTAGYYANLGMPMPGAMVWITAAIELIGGILILVGYRTAAAAIVLAAFCVGTAVIGHLGQGGEDAMLVMMNQQAFMKNLAIAGGFLVLAAYGPGSISVDARQGRGGLALA